MRLDSVLPAMAALLIVACAPAQEEGAEAAGDETAAVARTDAGDAGTAAAEAERAIMELERAWSRAFGEKDTVWIADRLAEGGRIMPPNAEPLVGRDAVAAWWGEMARTEGLELSWEPVEAHVSSSADMAYDVGTYDLTLPDGTADEGKYLVVWVMEDGEWRIAADMFSSDRPPPSATP